MGLDMDETIAKNYILAGKILRELHKKARKMVKPGVKLLDIADSLEKEITDIDKSAGPAFPANLSANDEAAHYTPAVNDARVVGEKDVLKVDLGVQVDGYIADAAFTVDLSGEWGKLVEASEKALQNAVSTVKVGMEVGKVGQVIEDTITSYGFKPVQNLCGHGLDQWTPHSNPSMPNVGLKNSRKLEEGMAIAIEPFATNGRGLIHEGGVTEIYGLVEGRAVRNLEARKIMEFIWENYKTLPWSERYVHNSLKFPDFKRKVAMRDLMVKGCIRPYPVLLEQKGAFVAQTETCMLLKDDDVIVLV